MKLQAGVLTTELFISSFSKFWFVRNIRKHRTQFFNITTEDEYTVLYISDTKQLVD